MPSELRRLTFSEREVMDAAATYAARTGRSVPPGKLRAVRSGPQPEKNFLLDLDNAADADDDQVLLEADFLGAALIMHCIDLNIPIPRRAERSLKVRDGVLSLYLRIEESSKEPAAALPDFYDYDFFG